jgi:hypothetical protein
MPWSISYNGDIRDETGNRLPLALTYDGRISFDVAKVATSADDDPATGYSVGANGEIVRASDGAILPWTVGANGDIFDEAGRPLFLSVTANGRIVFDPSKVSVADDLTTREDSRARLIERLTYANAELRREHEKRGDWEVTQETLAKVAGYSRQHLSHLASRKQLDIDLKEFQRVKGPPPRDARARPDKI